MIGIIGAMDIEVNTLKKTAENKTIKTVSNIEFVCGEIEGVRVCIAQCCPGKVNAALCTQMMLDLFDIELVINIGVGCSLSKDVTIMNIVVATEVCQYDFDTSAIDGVKGLVLNNTVKIPSDKASSDLLFASAEKSGATVHRGCVATGDTFIASASLKAEIAREFGAVCGEMEGGAIGQVCFLNGVPFAVLRSISDGGNENAVIDYPELKKIAASLSSSTVIDFLKSIKK